MTDPIQDTLTDYITGRTVFNTGAEANRQAVEKFLVEEKGYDKTDVEVDAPIEISVQREPYRSTVDLVVRVKEKRFMCIKCAAGSLGSRERETLSAARLLDVYQIPVSVISDGKTALVFDTVTGKKTGEGLAFIPDKSEALKQAESVSFIPVPEKRIERERIVFRSYDSMNVNRTIS